MRWTGFFGFALVANVLHVSEHTIVQKGKAFAPGSLEVKKGDTVIFTNDDDVVHNVFTASSAFRFNLKAQPPGASTTVSFTEAGAFEVRCAIHPTMKLAVQVK